MFADRKVTVMLPAKDVARARVWYKEKLGFEPVRVVDFGAVYKLAGGSEVFMYQTEFAGTAENTALSFPCTDLEADMSELRGKGVMFINYDLPGLKTVDGVAEFGPVKNAWAKDSEGNILGFVQGM